MLWALTGCDGAHAPAEAGPKAAYGAVAAAPLDARLGALQQRACASCHGVSGSGAPAPGDVDAWRERLARGEAALLISVREGKGAMPPMGFCPECSDSDLLALIRFLSGAQAPAISQLQTHDQEGSS
jgi:cytochrome c5